MKRCADKFGFGRLLTDLLYPRRCAICDEVLPMGEGLICRGHNSLPYVKTPSCMVCGKEVDSEERELCLDCEKHSRNFERGFPVFNYVEPVKASVLAIKYHNKKEYCDFYGAQMAEKVRPYVRRYGIDAVTCVPLHRRKQRQRGYNQAAVLAKVVADELGLCPITIFVTSESLTYSEICSGTSSPCVITISAPSLCASCMFWESRD